MLTKIIWAVLRVHSNNFSIFLTPPLLHVSFGDTGVDIFHFAKHKLFLRYIELKIGNYCFKKEPKMSRDTLVDPLPWVIWWHVLRTRIRFKSYRFSFFLTAACCPKRDFYTLTLNGWSVWKSKFQRRIFAQIPNNIV